MFVKMETALHHAVVLRLRDVFWPDLMLVAFPNPAAHFSIDRSDSVPLLCVTYNHKEPVLRIPGGWRLGRCFDNSCDQLVRNGIGFEPPHRTRRVRGFKQPNLIVSSVVRESHVQSTQLKSVGERT